jgi:hypothetical protein
VTSIIILSSVVGTVALLVEAAGNIVSEPSRLTRQSPNAFSRGYLSLDISLQMIELFLTRYNTYEILLQLVVKPEYSDITIKEGPAKDW